MKRFFLLLGAVMLTGCLDTTGPTPSNPSTETFASTLGVNISNMQKTASGTYYVDEVVGTGAALSAPQTNTTVNVDYSGYLKSGTLFDSGSNISFQLGGVILGFVDGMVGMKTGGTRLIVIPSELGYGNSTQNTNLTTIPPNSTLIFRVKLNGFTG